jgi:phosphocarrier protein
MRTIDFTVTVDYGLHARPAGQLVNVASKFCCTITVKKGDKSASAKGIFGLMGLGIKSGDSIKLEIEGTDEDAAHDAIGTFLDACLTKQK